MICIRYVFVTAVLLSVVYLVGCIDKRGNMSQANESSKGRSREDAVPFAISHISSTVGMVEFQRLVNALLHIRGVRFCLDGDDGSVRWYGDSRTAGIMTELIAASGNWSFTELGQEGGAGVTLKEQK